MADSTETIMMCGDSAEKLKEIKDNSVDMLCSDPPYSYGFMGKKWDKVLPDTEIWRQSYRVLKPGAFITIMAAPRTDVLWRISRDLEEAGFDLSFTNIEWVYHSGFPKATDISKSIDKRGGDLYVQAVKFGEYIKQVREEKQIGISKIDKDLFDGSTRYSWFEGRPAGQNVPTPDDYMKIKEYLDLDDRFDFIFSIDKTNVVDTIPMTIGIGGDSERHGDFKEITIPETDIAKKYEGSKAGFQPKPAREIIIVGMKPFSEGSYVDKVLNFEALPDNIKMTYPLIQTPKPAKKEKDFGLSGEEQVAQKLKMPHKVQADGTITDGEPTSRKNSHPTVKPIKLMSYLITLFTRPGDWILDPFGGSGTTGLACKLLDRNHIYIDFTEEYYDIAQERLQVSKEDLKKLLKEKISNGQQELF
jgi:site-specific DNA-methyltransferase (adenine-specific)